MIGERLKDGFLSMAIQKSKSSYSKYKYHPLIPKYSDSPYRETLNKGITKLQANGVIDSIREKWIRYSDRNCGKVYRPILLNSMLLIFVQVVSSQLTLHNIGGCFIILAAGVCLAVMNSILTILSKNMKAFNKKY